MGRAASPMVTHSPWSWRPPRCGPSRGPCNGRPCPPQACSRPSNPVVREACFPSARPAYTVEPAGPDDLPVIAQIVADHETPSAATILAAWCERHPETFAVARGQDGSVAAFLQVADLTDVDPDLLAADPLAIRWVDHLDEHTPGPDDQILLMRRWLGRESGELRSPEVSACWLDVKRIYMQLRPRLRRIYSDIVDLDGSGCRSVPDRASRRQPRRWIGTHRRSAR